MATGPLVFIVQHWMRPAAAPGSVVASLLGPAPNLIVGLCFPFIIVARPIFTPLQAARAFTLMTLATLGVLIVMEIVHPIPGAATFDLLDIVASVVGLVLSVLLYRRLAPRIAYAPPLTHPPARRP
jgi:hypothetical protein